MRGKGWEISQHRRFKEGEKEEHWKNKAGSTMWGIECGVREMVGEEQAGR